jgi:hypothetical protein
MRRWIVLLCLLLLPVSLSAGTYTTRFSLYIPSYQEEGTTWYPLINNNFSIIDGLLPPAPTTIGQVLCTTDGLTWTYCSTLNISSIDLSSASASIPAPVGTDPDTSTTGEQSFDSDGANITGDVSGRAFDGTNQFAMWRKMKDIDVTVISPNDLADATRDKFVFWENDSGMTFTVTRIKCWSDTDNTDVNIEEYDGDGQNNATVDAVAIADNGTGLYYKEETTISGATIEAGHLLAIDFDDSDTPGWVKCTIRGWFDANVD